MKHTVQKFLSFLLILLLLFSLTGCGQADSALTSVTFPQAFLTISGQTPDGWKESLESAGPGQFVRIQALEDRVVLELKESHREFWLQKFETRLQDLARSLSSLDPDYRIQTSEDYTSVDFYYNPELIVTQAIYHVVGTETYCICMQLLNGADADEWSVVMNLYNSDTGKLVATGNDRDGITYTKEDWEASK